MIDSHCHLADGKFRKDLPDVLARAKEAGVTHEVTIADNLEEASKCRVIAEKYDHIFYTAGVHPHEAKRWDNTYEARIHEHAKSKKMVAVGEIGLDYHYMNSPRDTQIDVFKKQMSIAKDLTLPIVVHNRESFHDLLPAIDELKPESMVLHCCTEPWEKAKEIVSRGYLLGFTGMATYPKLGFIREVIQECPLEQILIETDAPYLAPQSQRGNRCEPAMVAEVAALVAEIKELPLEEVDRVTAKNTMGFYGIEA